MSDKRKEQIQEAEILWCLSNPMWVKGQFIAGAEWADSTNPWRGIAEELAESLKSAKGWVVTHAMQTYNKRADQEAYEINILLQKFEQAVKGK